jgi:hypothetical protein
LLILTLNSSWNEYHNAAYGVAILEGEIMKTFIGKFVALALGVLVIGVSAVRAQIVNRVDFKMTQPFTVENTTLPAGRYTIRVVQGSDQGVLEISAPSGQPSVIVAVSSASPDSTNSGAQLFFHRYKNVMALSEVFPGGGNSGHELPQGHPEKQAAKTEQPTKQTVTGTAK